MIYEAKDQKFAHCPPTRNKLKGSLRISLGILGGEAAQAARQPGRQTSRRRKIFLRRKDNLCDTDGDKGKKDVCA